MPEALMVRPVRIESAIVYDPIRVNVETEEACHVPACMPHDVLPLCGRLPAPVKHKHADG